jgi:hypothetical protein
MGSIIDYIECPNCKHEAYNDFYYKTGEEYTNCGNCGYHYSCVIINREKKLNELDETDWKINELKNPYGAYRIKTYDATGVECGTLPTKTQFDELKQNINEKINIIEYCSVSRFIDNEIKVEYIVDNTNKKEFIKIIEEYKKNAPIKMKRKMYSNLNKKHKLRKINKFGYLNN